VKDWFLVAIVVLLGAGMASYEVYLYKQRHDWDTVYDRVLSNYKLAYDHRDDPGNLNTVAPWREYEAGEKELENIPMDDADKLQKFKSLQDCGLSLKAYHDLKVNKFKDSHFEKDAAACTQ
jgi:hypothetical protein